MKRYLSPVLLVRVLFFAGLDCHAVLNGEEDVARYGVGVADCASGAGYGVFDIG